MHKLVNEVILLQRSVDVIDFEGAAFAYAAAELGHAATDEVDKRGMTKLMPTVAIYHAIGERCPVALTYSVVPRKSGFAYV